MVFNINILMLTKTTYTVSQELINKALSELPQIDFRHTINQPTGDFFYDPWTVKEEFKNTVWEELIKELPNIGEARIIDLGYGKCYQAHADIDDRYHLTLHTDNSYLIDLDNDEMHKLKSDGVWHDMNAGKLHSAVNFGYKNRIELVVRKLLKKNKLNDPIKVNMKYIGSDKDTARFKFDNLFSPWLNYANKQGIISDFSFQHNDVNFKIEKSKLQELKNISTEEFKINELGILL